MMKKNFLLFVCVILLSSCHQTKPGMVKDFIDTSNDYDKEEMGNLLADNFTYYGKDTLGKSDYLKAEPWDMRIGPSLWTIVSDTFENVDSELLPYLYKRIAMLKPKVFISTMQEVFAKTRKGKKLMGLLVAKAKNDADYDKFSDRMTSLQTDKNLINDEYINENEL